MKHCEIEKTKELMCELSTLLVYFLGPIEVIKTAQEIRNDWECKTTIDILKDADFEIFYNMISSKLYFRAIGNHEITKEYLEKFRTLNVLVKNIKRKL